MSSAIVRQQSFKGGEVAPEFYGRTHDPRYGISLRTCKNFLPIVHGALLNRAGTRLLGQAKAGNPWFARFVFSDAQALVLEFTANAVRFWTTSGLVLNAGVPYEVATPYAAADLKRLVLFQSGDVITITHPSYQTRELTRLSNTSWTIAAVNFTPRAYSALVAASPRVYGQNPDGSVSAGAAVATTSIYSAVTTYSFGQFVLYQPGGGANPFILYQSIADANLNHQPDISAQWQSLLYNAANRYSKGAYIWQATNATDGQLYISIADNNIGNTPVVAGTAFWVLATDSSRPPKKWQWAVTVEWKDENGVVHETTPSTTTPEVDVSLYTDRPAQIKWPTPSLGGFVYKVLGFNVYRGRNGLFGLVDSVGIDPLGVYIFRDDAKAPDYGQQPPKGENPFTVADGVDAAATTNWPGAGTFHEQRRVFARSNTKPQTFWGSAVGDISNFDRHEPALESDSYEWKLSSHQLEEIRSLKSFGRLVLFTGQGEFSAQGKDGGAITPSSVEVRRHSSHGSSYLDPIEAEHALLFNTAKGNYIRDFLFDYGSNAYVGVDVTEFARHLFRGYTILAWAHQRVPHHLVWVVRSDGALLSLTYDRATQTIAWAQHPMDGQVQSVACIPNGTEDALLLVVARNGNNCVELMASRDYIPDQRLACFLDSSLTFDGRNTSVVTMKVTGASYAAGDLVTVEASAASFDVAGSDVNDQVVIDPDGTPTRITVTVFTDTTHVTGRLEGPLPAANQNAATTSWGWARDTFGNLAHLEGKSVTVLADGVPQAPFVVVAGSIGPLSPPALIAVAGLPYNSDAELLDLAADSVKPNVKSVLRATVEVVGSRGISAGEDFDHLRPAKLPQSATNYLTPPLVTGQVEVGIKSTWNTGGRACIRQSDPLPLTITAMIREVELGGR